MEESVESREASEHFWKKADLTAAPVLDLDLGDPCCRSSTQVRTGTRFFEGRLGQTELFLEEW